MPDVKFSNLYPYTDFHEINLDWVIKEVKFWSERVGKSIQKIELTETVGLVDTYTITYSDGTTSTFDVTNGNGIASVAKTGTAGLVDTYTITFTDDNTTTFDVHNGTASIDTTLTLSGYAADAKSTGIAIDGVKYDVQKILDKTGIDFFDTGISASGVYLNRWGGDVPAPTYQVSVFIPVHPSTAYLLPHNSHYFIHSYNDSQVIDPSLWVEVASTSDPSYTFTTGSNIYYLKFSYPIGASFFMYEGTTLPQNTLDQAYSDIALLKSQYTPVIHITPSSDIIDILKNNYGATFIIEDGLYDIIAIYKAKYGNSYFENKSTLYGEPIENYGLPLKNGSRLICSPNAKFVCNYTGTNTYTIYGFAAFACGNGYEIDGLNVEVSNVKYAIHDDYNDYNNVGYTSIIRNSRIVNANRDAIGGGNGKYGTYVFENNYFENTNGTYDVRYHNNAQTSECKFIINNNYFVHTLRMAYYGTSLTGTSPVFASNNRFTANIINDAETPDSTINNYAIYPWNNQIDP